jgi:N6-L-threonylcarbamoyladenine synthase
VAANRRLRRLMQEATAERGLSWRVAPLSHCTDNAAMVGLAAVERFEAGGRSGTGLGVAPRLPLEQAGVLYAPRAPF